VNAFFIILFGLLGVSALFSMGPDRMYSIDSGTKIFKMIDTPTKIDAMTEESGNEIDIEAFKGKIEFRNVWFRYPTQPDKWIFNGLNLTINSKESVALVGEKGSGKTSIVNLILRFYDPDFGEVLIDDKDAKYYNIQELRKRMGVVMQNPMIFNYTIKDNLLYGNMKASNH
jgi:ABC-type multidrug transport system fused ATPase/permease subunit